MRLTQDHTPTRAHARKMAASGQDQQRESHLISLKVMRLSRPSLVTGHGLYFNTPKPATSSSSQQPIPPQESIPVAERPNLDSILSNGLSELSLSQLERVHPPSSGTLIHPSSEGVHATTDNLDQPTGTDHDPTLDMGNFGVSELLTMPAAFGNIYLGETFTSYICANNESPHPVRDVILKAELQTTTLRFALSDTLASQRNQASATRLPAESSLTSVPSPSSSTGGHIQLLESGKTNEMIVSHEIKELGIHILVCSIQYSTLDGQQKSFRKFYKFQVMNPLSVKTKVNHPPPSTMAISVQDGTNQNLAGSAINMNVSRGGLVMLEAMVQNVSGVTMWMERMRFEPADAFTIKDLNVVIEDDDSGDGQETESKEVKPGSAASIFGEHDYFAPNDIRQYLYVLTPKAGKELLAKTTNVLGKMDILWRSQFGETGRLQTSQLTRKPAPLEEIAVQVIRVPERIHPMLGGMLARPPAAVARGGFVPPNRPFDTPAPPPSGAALHQVSSPSLPQPHQQQASSASQDQNAMKLMLTGVKQKMGAILLSGPNSRQLGSVPAGGEVRVRLDWFPLTSGVQKIGGIRIVDIISGYTVEIDHLTHCFVEHT
ncbi:hypothetical protein KVV02_000937 [Mortierella alpina]|uniref:Trafficking protein particle complex subunit 13 n=1 Tax=Mortierella alpina TaxID=64518 RepID=A0A9P8A5V1_MORAP|nr:hypothetical protein KVV02_000937 [Mortierella alpina]